jgi:hypothetical protein
MTVGRLQLPPVGETMFTPFFKARLGTRSAQVAARAEEKERGNLPVSPGAPPPGHRARGAL